MASPVYLKISYHNEEGKTIVINANLKKVSCIKDIILKDILASSAMVEEGPGKADMFDLDARKDEVRLVSYEDFEVVQLYNNCP